MCCIAKDNGRTREFIRRREYPDKTRCYECGEFGHLSYKCDKNVLGERRRPRKKKKKKGVEKEEVDDYFNPDISLAEAIAEDAESASIDSSSIMSQLMEQNTTSAVTPQNTREVSHDNFYQTNESLGSSAPKCRVSGKKYMTDSYFSDEEILEEKE